MNDFTTQDSFQHRAGEIAVWPEINSSPEGYGASPLGFSAGHRQLGSGCWHVAEHFPLVLFGGHFVVVSLFRDLSFSETPRCTWGHTGEGV